MSEIAHVITANRLSDGTAVFWTGAGWSERFAEATPFVDPDAEASALVRAAEDVSGRIIVNPYAFDVALDAGQATPVRQRERVRASGQPTIDAGPWALTAHY